MTKEIGIVLSGGGFRGAAHAGLLQALEEKDIKITKVSGSSAGALVGALYCAGYKPAEILEFFRSNTDLFKFKYLLHGKPGLFDSDLEKEIFREWLDDRTFESLEKELYICVTDILNGRTHFFSKGDLIKPLLASAAIPGVFTPVKIDQTYFSDGGIMNNFPIEPLLGSCDLLLGSYASPKKILVPEEINSIRKVLTRTSNLALLANSADKFYLCDYIFSPKKLGKYEVLNNERVEEIYQIGYEEGMKILSKIKDSSDLNSLLHAFEKSGEH
ncbi:MAG: patatin-like phospholipase family protein [Cyclobacteriaceae bacterium]